MIRETGKQKEGEEAGIGAARKLLLNLNYFDGTDQKCLEKIIKWFVSEVY